LINIISLKYEVLPFLKSLDIIVNTDNSIVAKLEDVVEISLLGCCLAVAWLLLGCCLAVAELVQQEGESIYDFDII
jgi:hypothetical protein